MPSINQGWTIMLDGDHKDAERDRVSKLCALVAADLGLDRLSASNLFRHALSQIAEQHGVKGFPLLQHGGPREAKPKAAKRSRKPKR